MDICADAEGVIMSDEDFFPKEQVALKGMRIYGDRKIGDIIIDAASVLSHEDSILGRIFFDMLQRNNKLLREVASVTRFEAQGIIAQVEQREVIIGNYGFLMRNGIIMPDERPSGVNSTTVHCYIAVSGELCCAFTIEYQVQGDCVNTVHELSKNDVSIFLRGSVIGLTLASICENFNIRVNTIKRIGDKNAVDLEKEERENDDISDGLFIKDGSARAFVLLILACKKFDPCVARNRIIKIFATFTTPAFVFLFAIIGAGSQVTPFNTLVTMLIWLIPVLLNSLTA